MFDLDSIILLTLESQGPLTMDAITTAINDGDLIPERCLVGGCAVEASLKRLRAAGRVANVGLLWAWQAERQTVQSGRTKQVELFKFEN